MSLWADTSKRVAIIAELGINHGGSVGIARALIDAAAAASVWGVKFQYRNLDTAYAVGSRQIGDEILEREISRNYLSPKQVLELADHAESHSLQVGISFFSPADMADFGDSISRFHFFKVPSVEMTNTPLIRRIEEIERPALISTGAYRQGDVDAILSELRTDLWVPLHCVSNYPVAIANPKLGYLSYLRRHWPGPIGYSSHDEFWETCLLAIQLGARVIERHITLDKKSDGLDHSSSSTPDEFDRLASFAAHLPLIVAGDAPRTPNQGELLNLQNLGRSFYARRDIAAGDRITPEILELRSPRIGLGQEDARQIFGSRALRFVKQGEVLNSSVFSPPIVLTDEDIEFAITHRLSLPVRFHDFSPIRKRFPIRDFEFHLSFGDVAGDFPYGSIPDELRYSVHLPDYVAPTLLMDPFSPDSEQRDGSLRILDRTVDFARTLQDRTGFDVPVVGSFSVVHTNLADFYRDHAELLGAYREDGVMILPQWLPPVAWYFGGAVRLHAMNDRVDAEQLIARGIPFCMDVCHLCMGEKVFGFDTTELISNLTPLIRHAHIADAAGFDGEGMHFGDGDPGNMSAVSAVLPLDCAKVIEVWQGHLDGGAGFASALRRLRELSNAQ